MTLELPVSRRGFVGGLATALGTIGLSRDDALWAHTAFRAARAAGPGDDNYDGMAKLANNENPYGPSEAVMKAMTKAFKYSNRYQYPDGDIVAEIARFHAVKPENVLIASGSGEILNIACSALLTGERTIVGAEPSYAILYQHAAGLKSDTIKIPLLADAKQDIPAMVRATRMRHRDVGFVYLCNPNNPTGRIVSAAEVREVLDGVPEDIPVLIDEAYHHFVEDSSYATSVPYVLEARNVIVTRTFSKIAGLAGMRLGYALAPKTIIDTLKPHGTGSINAIVKWGGVAALHDAETQARVKRVTIELRTKAMADLTALGYATIPSETNFFMVNLRRPVLPAIDEFKKRGVLVGRPFPPMNEHLRVSIGAPEEMARFASAFREIFVSSTAKTG